MDKKIMDSKPIEEFKKLLDLISQQELWRMRGEYPKEVIDQFMKELPLLYFDYFQDNENQVWPIAHQYQCALSYFRDYVKVNTLQEIEQIVSDEYLDGTLWIQLYDARIFIEVFNQLFGAQGYYLESEVITQFTLKNWHALPARQEQSRETTGIRSDAVYAEKLNTLFLSLYGWVIDAPSRKEVYLWMDGLWVLYLDHFQYHQEEARDILAEHKKILLSVMHLFHEHYVFAMKLQTTVCCECNEDMIWQRLCLTRSKIQAFNELCGFLRIRLDDAYFVEKILLYFNHDAVIDIFAKPSNLPPSHWWWHCTEY